MFSQTSIPAFILLLWFPITSSPAWIALPFSNTSTFLNSGWSFKQWRKPKHLWFPSSVPKNPCNLLNSCQRNSNSAPFYCSHDNQRLAVSFLTGVTGSSLYIYIKRNIVRIKPFYPPKPKHTEQYLPPEICSIAHIENIIRNELAPLHMLIILVLRHKIVRFGFTQNHVRASSHAE